MSEVRRFTVGNCYEDPTGRYVLAADYAARVAELEAALDRAERLAAAEAWYADQNGPSAAEGTLSLALSGDLAAFSENPQRDRYIAAVQAVTRTPADAPPHATQGEDAR